MDIIDRLHNCLNCGGTLFNNIFNKCMEEAKNE